MKIEIHARAVFLVLALAFLVACGGSSSSGKDEPSVVQGQFIDSVVIGLSYKTATMSGFTDDQGRFSYRRGEMVRFFVGDVFVGEAMGQAIITPVELVAGAVDENNDQVLNIAVFLQSIDEDGDESNGIKITKAVNDEAVGKNIDFTLAAGDFDADGAIQILISSMIASNGAAHPMVSREQARNAFRVNLLGLLVGEYRGTFTGDDRGSWVARVDASGAITGTSTSEIYEVEDTISGTLSSSGEANMSGTVGTSVFSGNFSRSGQASGAWTNADEDSGTFTGRRVSSIIPPDTSEEAKLPGCWNWSNGVYIVIDADGTARNGLVNATWISDDIAEGRYTITWPPIVDTVSLSADGRKLNGTNTFGFPITATRVSGGLSGIEGEWSWNNIILVTARSDSSISGNGFSGTWSKSGDNWLVAWPVIDSVLLAADGNSLSLRNQFGTATATRDKSCMGG